MMPNWSGCTMRACAACGSTWKARGAVIRRRSARPCRHGRAGWPGRAGNIQVYASLDAIAAAALGLRGLPVPVVLDHFAMIPAETPLEDPRVRQVLALLGDGQAYIKLSGAYRVCRDAADPAQAGRLAALAQAIVRRNPERVLWASDWPHTNREPGKRADEVSAYRAVPAQRLRDALDAWLPQAAERQQVLAVNPATLYGF